ncbi:MAG: DUF3352 domain-containing protein [Gemmataceae bacterium]|nr:DUF3352 domain-containing protein [Gemmataceae bacterium]
MSRPVGCGLALLLLAAPAGAADPPEALLSPSTQLYLRWDGVTPHKAAYDGSALGAVMKGPTGDSVRALLAKGPKLLGSNLLADPLLEGRPPEELKAVHADLKHAERLLDLLADTGVVVAAEVNEPRPTLAGVGKALGGLLGAGPGPSPDAFLPDARVFVVVPNAGAKADILLGAIRLVTRQADTPVEPLPATLERAGYLLKPKNPGVPVKAAWWVEGDHFVFYVGSATVESAVKGVRANLATGGLTNHPLFARCQKTGDYEAVARGYVDTASVVGLAKRLAGPFVPGLADKVDAVGLGNLKAVVFSSGFKGKESRAVYEFDLPGERKGLARILKSTPVTLADLPPLPPDASRFSLLRVDYTAAFDAGLTVIDALVQEQFGVEDQGKTPAEISKLRREFLERELNKAAGIDARADLLAHLGDKVCIYQSPTEGLSVLGTVLCISVKDGPKVKTAADRLARTVEGLAGGRVKVRKKTLAGVELREVYGRDLGFFVPTYAVVGDWLVIAAHPQPVQGMVLRHAGTIPRWKPDADTARRLGGMPADAIGVQYCDPRSPAQNLCTVGPLALGFLGLIQGQRGSETDFDPIDIGLVPNGHELARHLFPNLTYTRDDGKTVRVEVNESFSLPLEFAGLEVLAFTGVSGLFGF